MLTSRTLTPRSLVASVFLLAGAMPQVSADVTPLDAAEEAKLTAFGPAAGDEHGISSAIDGDTVVVGAWRRNADMGSVYVYTRSGTTWGLPQTLTRPGTGGFGRSVAIDGDTLVVGAPGAGGGIGDANVFVRSGSSWAHQAQLLGEFTSQEFGYSVGISGDSIVVGDRYHHPMYPAPAIGPGAAFVFTRSGTIWSQQQRLANAAGLMFDEFGFTTAIEGDRILVGVPGDDDLGLNAGSTFVYLRSGTTWTVEDHVYASGGGMLQVFGLQVALSGDTALISSRVGPSGIGDAHVFARSGSTWTEQTRLLPADHANCGASGCGYGFSVALDVGTAVVGKIGGKDSSGVATGSAHVFTRQGTTWREEAKVTPSDGADDDRFGFSCGLDGDRFVVGAYYHDLSEQVNAGAAYVWRLFPISTPFCDDSDGSLASCPCANPGDADTGCDIAQATGGVQLTVCAQETSPNNRATVQGTGFSVAGSPTAIVIRATDLDNDTPVVFGDGLRCVGTPVVRLGAAFATNGTSTHTFGHGAMAGGGTFYYQLWFRNTPAMYCTPEAFNLSNGATLNWPGKSL